MCPQEAGSKPRWKQLYQDEEAPSYLAELSCLMKLAAPACIQLLGTMLITTTNQALVGKELGPKELCAASISVTLFNFCWYGVLGASTGLDSLASQAWGLRDRAAVLAWTAASLVVLTAICLPVALLLWFSEPVALHFFQQPADISQMVALYCRWMIPGLLPFTYAVCLMKCLQAQNLFWAPAIITALACVLNVPLNHYLIRAAGFAGAAVAPSVTRGILLLAVVVYMTTWGRQCLDVHGPDLQHPSGPDRHGYAADTGMVDATVPLLGPQADQTAGEHEARLQVDGAGEAFRTGLGVHYLWGFSALALPGGVLMAADAASFDITTAFAGFLGTTEVDAHTALFSLTSLAFMSFPFGVATAASIRVGNLLGEGRPKAAKAAGVMCIASGAGFLWCIGLLILGFRHQIGRLFVNDHHVVQMVASICPIAAVWTIPDGLLGTIQGVLRGMGKQGQMVMLSLIGFWGIGVMTEYTLTFTFGLGLKGLWIGIVTGVSATAIMCAVLLGCADWQWEAAKARGETGATPSPEQA